MIQLKIDDKNSDLLHGDVERSRLGELVHSVYEELPENRLVTRVLINGNPLTVEGQENELLQGENTEIEFKTVDRLVWKANGVENCLSILERVQTSLIKTAELFRATEKARANRFFAQCIESLEKFLESMTITRLACKLDFNAIRVEGVQLSKVEESLTGILKSVLEAQETANYEELADKIEFELITNLYNWKTALQAIRNSQNSNT